MGTCPGASHTLALVVSTEHHHVDPAPPREARVQPSILWEKNAITQSYKKNVIYYYLWVQSLCTAVSYKPLWAEWGRDSVKYLNTVTLDN